MSLFLPLRKFLFYHSQLLEKVLVQNFSFFLLLTITLCKFLFVVHPSEERGRGGRREKVREERKNERGKRMGGM